MRNYLLPLLLAAIWLSCKKDVPVNGTFTFKANGVSYTWSGPAVLGNENAQGGAIAKSNLSTAYFMMGFDYKDHINRNRISFSLTRNPQLETTSYRLNGGGPSGSLSGEVVFLTSTSSKVYACLHSGDYIIVTINEIKNGYASGTFQAKLTGTNGIPHETMEITGGAFEKVKIITVD
jgi:hypothetical protein